MAIRDSLVIVGAGTAASELAFAARQRGWQGDITLLGAEPLLPYHRPPLSKAFLCGTTEADSLLIKPAAAYDAECISVRTGVEVTALQPAHKTLRLNDGSSLAYTRLAICTGSRPRLWSAPGMPVAEALPNVHYLRSHDHAHVMRHAIRPGTRLVVLGAGYIGLEVAASARKLGAEVVVLEAQPRVLARVTGPAMSAFYEHEHRRAGVDLRCSTGVQRVECDSASGRPVRFKAVVCSDGTRIEADALLVGIGGLPNVELAAKAGLTIDRGIVVDAHSRTSACDIYAAGDCTVFDSARYGRRIRLESVPNALEQARAAAAALCGISAAYDAVPWFWSDQYDLKLQMAGLSEGHDQTVLRGDMASRAFSMFYLLNNQLLAVDSVNRPADFLMTRRLMGAGVAVSVEQLRDATVPLKSLLPAAA